MKTTCYCLYCPRHPLHSQRKSLPLVTGWDVGKFVWDSRLAQTGIEVDCLDPVSDAFDVLDVDPSDYDFETTAYGDGVSLTGIDQDSFRIWANCGNEKYED